MTHYQKLATMIFRIIGLIIIIGGSVSWIQTFFFAPKIINASLVLFAVLPYLIVGMVLFVLSRFLARWICLDFDKFNESK